MSRCFCSLVPGRAAIISLAVTSSTEGVRAISVISSFAVLPAESTADCVTCSNSGNSTETE
ncbi:MAG: hypothetical protein ACKVHQ_11840 [Gammaproteobacteria bacterium]